MLKPAMLLIVVCSTTTLMPEEKPNSEAAPKQRWEAKADLKAMNGRWKIVSTVRENAFDFYTMKNATPIARSLYKTDAILNITDGKFAIEAANLAGVAKNDMNKIEFIPQPRWMNIQEPKLQFILKDGTKENVSYIVKGDHLTFRYPANSCSRSGVQFSFVRVPEKE